MPKEKDGFTLLEDIVEGFADAVDGSIFDFDDETEIVSNGGRNSGNESIGFGETQQQVSKSKPGRPTKPGVVEGVTISDPATGDPKKKGTATGKQKQDDESTGSGGTGGNELPADPAK